MTGLRRLAAGLLLLAASSPAAAACSVSAQGVAFGNYDPLSATALNGVGNVHVSCNLLSPIVTVSLDSGGGTVADRRMTAGAAQLHYNLYLDASRLFVWGEGSASVTSAVVLNLDLPVYGRIPALQNVPAGTYLDSVTVTIAY
jgi:spore coat protein U-like protein